MSEKRVYLNKPQRLRRLIGANTTVIVAKRKTDKTDSLSYIIPLIWSPPPVLPADSLGQEFYRAISNAPNPNIMWRFVT